jgi:hypothetical protein
MHMISNYSTSILRYPSGRFGIVGSVPVALTKERGGMFPGRDSMVWATEQEAIDALLSVGVTRFQLADCSWFKQHSIVGE